MPSSRPIHPAVPPRGMSRRSLLRAAAAAAGIAGVGSAAGCDLFGGSGDAPDLPPELTDLLAGTVALGDAYDDAIARVPSLAEMLGAPRDAHRAHAQLLAQAMQVPVPASGGGQGNGSNDPGAVRAALAEMETQGQGAARRACLSAPPRLASLIGTLAAARACHLEVLR